MSNTLFLLFVACNLWTIVANLSNSSCMILIARKTKFLFQTSFFFIAFDHFVDFVKTNFILKQHKTWENVQIVILFEHLIEEVTFYTTKFEMLNKRLNYS